MRDPELISARIQEQERVSLSLKLLVFLNPGVCLRFKFEPGFFTLS